MTHIFPFPATPEFPQSCSGEVADQQGREGEPEIMSSSLALLEYGKYLDPRWCPD